MRPDSDIKELKGVGDELAKKLAKLSITTIYELIDYLPRRFDDFSKVEPINKIKPGQVTIRATISQAKGRYVRRGMHVTEAIASDESGSLRLVWFNQPYRASSIKPGNQYFISGEFALRRQHFSIQNPSCELASEFPVNTARILPVYRETKGLKSSQIRKLLKNVLPIIDQLPETLPDWLIKQEKLISRAEAYKVLHFPSSMNKFSEAKRRLAFEEVFRLTLAALLNKHELLQEKAVVVPFDKDLAVEFVNHLPFELTDAQRKVVWQIYLDMSKTQPMNRLVEGDVGSGKTVVATMAAIMAIKQDFQVVFMAPTELLARQHADTVYRLLKPLNMQNETTLLVGSLAKKQKEKVYSQITKGKVKIIIGTHALIQEKVTLKNLGLAIVDEEHRFGVEQRKKLQAKAGHAVHVLNMTATPIPRSLALTLYGELDISIIDALPAGRQPIITKLVSPNSKKALYQDIEAQLKAGRQAFFVTPLIEESAVLSARSAREVYEELKLKIFKKHKVGLLHGKLTQQEKEKVMADFLGKKIDILVATTVVEVGVDVPNATVMVIENAEMFGLAQIHQLRGRIGRSSHQGYAYLVLGDSRQPSRRLRAIEHSNNGFELAEMDLEIRGPGAIYGSKQHGELDLRIAKLSDSKLIAKARRGAQAFIDKGEDLLKYKELHTHVSRLRAVTNLN